MVGATEGAAVLRPATRADVPALGVLHRALDRSWWGREETDDDEVTHQLEWVGDLGTRTRVVPGADGLTGFAALTGSGEGLLAVSPTAPAEVRREVADALLAWLVSTAPRSAQGARQLEVGAPRPDEERLAALERHGLLPLRSQYDLDAPADLPLAEPSWPEGVELVPFDRALAPALHALVYSVWTDVPGHHHRPYDEWRHLFLGHTPFDPGLQVVAARDGEPVGVALCRVYAGTDGWVSQLAVARRAQRQGLGRALLLEALRRLAAADGTELVGLGVSARNPAALRLYLDVGLTVARDWVVCTPAGADPAGDGTPGPG